MTAPKTQRVANGHSYYIGGTTPDGSYTLVVPEEVVKGCNHWRNDPQGKWNGWCPNCGAAYDENRKRWQRPRVLRVGRASK